MAFNHAITMKALLALVIRMPGKATKLKPKQNDRKKTKRRGKLSSSNSNKNKCQDPCLGN